MIRIKGWVFRIAGGAFLVLVGLGAFVFLHIPTWLMGGLALAAGIGLLIGW